MTSTHFEIKGPQDRSLRGIVDLPNGGGPRPVVVICHGFKGFQEWGFFPPLAELVRQRGWVAVRFNFSGSGMRPGDDLVTDPEAFRANTYRAELEDLLAVLGALDGEIAPGRIDPSRIALVGHSRGGAAALLAAAKEDHRDAIRALVTWAAIGRIDRFGAEAMERWRRDGDLEVVNGRTGQRLLLGSAMLAELEAVPADLDLASAAGRLRAPWLILHGDGDEAVDVQDARDLRQAAGGEAQLQVVAGGGHTFGARHPFTGPTPQLIEVLNSTQTWLRRHLD